MRGTEGEGKCFSLTSGDGLQMPGRFSWHEKGGKGVGMEEVIRVWMSMWLFHSSSLSFPRSPPPSLPPSLPPSSPDLKVRVCLPFVLHNVVGPLWAFFCLPATA